MGAEYQRLIPDSRLIVWDATGHCPMIEHPARFDDVVAAFLAATDRVRRPERRRECAPEVFIAGAFVTPFGKFLDRTLRSLAAEAVAGVLADAGAHARRDRRGVLRQRRRGVSHRAGVHPRPGGAAGHRAARQADRQRRERLRLRDNGLSARLRRRRVRDGGRRAGDRRREADQRGQGPGPSRSSTPVGTWNATVGPDPSAKQSAFMGVYAEMARAYMERSGATVEDFARVSVKSHDCGALNPNAQYRDPLTVDEVLASRAIVDPLTLLMCSPIGDGAAAVVVASSSGAAAPFRRPGSRAGVASLRSGVRQRGDGGGHPGGQRGLPDRRRRPAERRRASRSTTPPRRPS